MAKKTNKVSVSQLEKIIKFQNKDKEDKITISFENEDGKFDVEVLKTISITNMILMVDGVVNNLFDEDSNFISAIQDFVFYKAILAYFTNVDISNISDDMLNDLIYKTNIMGRIIEVINQKQFNNIEDSIHSAIKYKKQEILSNQRYTLEENLNQLFIATKSIETFTEMFKDMDVNKLAKFIDNNNNISEKKIVDNVLDYNYNKKK